MTIDFKGAHYPKDVIVLAVFFDLVARIPVLLLGCGFPNLWDIVDAV